MTRATILAITSVLVALACARPQAPATKAPRAGKPLVTRLPADVEGVELVGDTLQAKPGYEFVKEPDGTISVARMGGGLGVGGSWSCDCEGPSGGPGTGDCQAEITGGGRLQCLTGKCNGSCNLTVVVGGLRTSVIAY